MLPTKRDGTPLCQIEQLGNNPLSWPKLWKHHGALAQTARMNSVARERNESFLSRYGGTIGLEWFFPKMLETIELAPEIDEQTDVWIEAGDWFVWQLTGGAADDLCRSTCQAGYKGLWSREDGYPSSDYLNAVHPQLAVAARDKLPGRMMSPGECGRFMRCNGSTTRVATRDASFSGDHRCSLRSSWSRCRGTWSVGNGTGNQ